MLEKFTNLYSNDFDYLLEYDYDYNSNCEMHGCYDEGICRCSEIEFLGFDTIDLVDVTNKIYKRLTFNNDLSTQRAIKLTSIMDKMDIETALKYAINRILTINEMWNVDLYEPIIEGGWYGEEFDGIELEKSVYDKFSRQMNCLSQYTNCNDIIYYVLRLEYGSILDCIKDKSFNIYEVTKSDVYLGQEKHKESVKQKDLSHYKRFDLPRAIALWTEKGWRVLDGYHRVTACPNESTFQIIGAK